MKDPGEELVADALEGPLERRAVGGSVGTAAASLAEHAGFRAVLLRFQAIGCGAAMLDVMCGREVGQADDIVNV
jgi:hypothetical protein